MEDGVAVWEGVGEGGAGEEDLAVGVEEREEVELTAGVEFADDVIDEEGDIGGGELLSDDVEAGEFECEGGHATFAGGAEVDEGGVVEEAGQAGAVGAAVGVAVSAVAFELLVEGVVEALCEGVGVEEVGVALEEVSDAGEIGGGEFTAVLDELSGLLDKRLIEA